MPLVPGWPMDATAALVGFDCRDCGRTVPPAAHPRRCPNCGGLLVADYDLDVLGKGPVEPVDADGPRPGSLVRFADRLPVVPDAGTDLAAGGTPLVECPRLAGELGVERVLL